MTDNSEILVKKDRASKPPGDARARLEHMLMVSEENQDFEHEFKSAKRIGLIIVFVVFGVFGLWSLVMPIDGAAHAPGQVTVKSFRKPVQHLEGGIIKEVRVHDGDKVKAGDVLVVLDDTQARSQLGILTTQLNAKLALEARLIAERDNLPAAVYPSELRVDDLQVMAEISAQNQLFKTRRSFVNGEVAVLQQRIEQLQTRVGGLESVQQSKTLLATSYQEEAKDFRALLAEGFTDKIRLRELERNYAIAAGESADLTSNIASTKMQIGEAKLEILQTQNKFQSDLAGQLSEAQTQLKDLRERITALTDTVQRAAVQSLDNGVIYNLKVHTAGTVIGPGVVLAEVVPQSDELIVEARVSPMDIDRVAIGQEAKVRMSAFNSRSVPVLRGKVIDLSADSIVEPNGASFYLARLELTPDSLQALSGLKLVPGMPAEVMIETGSRTFFQYMMKPLSDSMARSLRED